MVEENAVAGEDPVGLPVIHGVPMSRAFGCRVGGSRVERGGLRLRGRSRSEHLRRPGLVVPDVRPTGGGDVGAHGLEEAEGAGGDDVGSVVRDFEGDGDMGLGGEVVDLVGEDGVEPAAEGGGVGEVGIVELHAGLVGIVGIDVDVIDPLRIEIGRSANEAVDFIAFVEEKFSEV